MIELPQGWELKTFGDVLSLVTNGINGKQNKGKSGIPVSRIETIANQSIDMSRVGYLETYDKNKIDKYLLNTNDILFSHINSALHLGKTALVPEGIMLYHGVNLLRLSVNKLVEPKYFNYYCKYFRLLGGFSANAQHAVNQSSLNQKKLKTFSIPLASKEEQKHIVDKLDSVLTKVEAAQARLEKIPTLLKRFRQSVLAAATSGELTKDWRESNCFVSSYIENIDWSVLDGGVAPYSIPKNWSWQHVGNLIDIHNSKRKPLKQADRDKRSGDYPYYGAFGIIDDIDDYLFDGSYLLLAEDGKNLESRQRPISLIANGKFWVNNHAHVIKERENVSLEYLMCFFNSPTIEIDQFLTGMDQVKLNKSSMIKLPIPLPSFEEQEEIRKRVYELFSHSDTVEKQFKVAKIRLDKLTQSILAKAFRGELLGTTDEQIESELEQSQHESVAISGVLDKELI